MPDLKTAANAAIRAEVRLLRQDYEGGWALLVPKDAPLSLDDIASWTGFLGQIIANYNLSIAPQKTEEVASFLNFQDKQLHLLRDEIVDKTT